MSRSLEVTTRAALLALAAAALVPGRASPCGAFYGDEVAVDPDQEIVVVHRAGVETYVFMPRFCGEAADFGVILPIPSTLTANPTLANATLFGELEAYTTPSTVEACKPSGGVGCAGSTGAGDDGTRDDFGTGADVVDKGRVGIFEWSLVQASSVSAFTDWLAANGLPYDPGVQDAYQHYVSNGWYFVAFKVSADAAPPAGMQLCGDLGPIQLSFAAPAPVVPARIASVNAYAASRPRWRIFVVAGTQQRVTADTDYSDALYFSGTLADAELAHFGELAALSEDGERLTAIDVDFFSQYGPTDITFEVDPSPADFRSTLTRYKDCGGCEAGGTPSGFAGAAAALALLRALRRGRRPAPESPPQGAASP